MRTRKGIIWFLICVVLLSAAVDVYLAMGGADIAYLVLMWMPAVAALVGSIVILHESGKGVTPGRVLHLLGFRKCKFRYVLLGAIIPFIYITIPYGIYWILYPGSLHTTATSVGGACIGILFMAVMGDILGLVSALGEEIGWRGFWVPRMKKLFGTEATLAITSIFWCLWHIPLIVFDDYMNGTPLWYNLLAFVLCIFPVGVIAGILAMKTKSVWPSAMLHAAHNNYDQAIFGLRTVGENKMYFVSETGVLTIACAWIIAVAMYLWYRKSGITERCWIKVT